MAQFIELATFRKRIMAEMAADVLRSEGIPALVQGIEPGMFGPSQHHMVFSARLLVPDDAITEARAVVEHLLDDFSAPGSTESDSE